MNGGEGRDRDPVEVRTTGFGRAKTEHTREDHVYLGRSFQEHPSRDSRASDSTWVACFVLLWVPPSKKREGRTAGAPSPRPPPPPRPPRPLGPTHAVARDKRRAGARSRALARAHRTVHGRPSSDVRRRAARPGQEDHLKDEKVRLCARFGGEGVGRGLARRRSEVRCRDRGGVHRRVHRRARSGVRRPRGSLRASPKTPLPVAAASALLGACTHRQERCRRRAHGSARPTGARIRLSCSGSNASGHITPAHTRDRRRAARAFRQPRQLHRSRAGASRP